MARVMQPLLLSTALETSYSTGAVAMLFISILKTLRMLSLSALGTPQRQCCVAPLLLSASDNPGWQGLRSHVCSSRL